MNPTKVDIIKTKLLQSGDTVHLVPDFSRKLSLVDAELEESNPISPAVLSGVQEKSQSPPAVIKSSPSIDRQESDVNASPVNKFVCCCGEKFEKSVQIASHKRWSCKFKQKTAQCEVCESWFATDVGLKRHMKHAHGGIVSCANCNLRFPTKIKLTRHWIEAHHDENKEGFKQLKCFVCNDTNFDSKFELECHLVVHKYEKHHKKIANQGLWTHFAPYHMPFMRPPFPHMSRSSCQFFPRHPPPMPTHFLRHPPPFFPPPFPLPQFPFPPHVFNSSAPTSSSQTNDSLSTKETVASPLPQESFPEDKVDPSNPNLTANFPRHDHVFDDYVVLPPYFPQHHHHHKKHGKLKWKKYMKLMIKGKVPMLWNSRQPPYAKEADVEMPSNANASNDKSDEQSEFKIACKFCDSIIQRNRINWHQRRECPVLAIHKCGVCDRVFRKRHFLIRHMHEQNHFTADSQPASTAPSTDMQSSNLSTTQEKLNSSLQLLKVTETVSTVTNKGNQSNMEFSTEDKETIAPQLMEDKSKTSVIIEDRDILNKFQSECCVCKHVFFNKAMLCDHLRGHISQILTIQKVHEWTLKSSDYFYLGNPDEEQTTATSSSCLDTEITSTTESLVPENSTDLSDLKWTKPHTKRNSHHAKGEMLLCEFCSEHFSFRKDLHYHMETQHKDCTLKCPLCKKKFSWKKRGKFYERHLNSHFGVKVFKHKCEVCGKTFLENSKLRAHMSLHNNDLLHRCSVCQKGYANKSSLVRHERMHKGIKPYQCETCSESFMEKRELLRHSTAHTGVAPFICGECGQGFTLKTSLVSHLKKKHNK
ncbi:hypothetical protein BgiMline_017540 [Biomphalaria glabrata]|nr:zinc finger protein 341 [Biomphalaria glabrata]